MTKYLNSECEAHRNIKTGTPVCIVCMANEVVMLRRLAQASLDAGDKEARAAMSLANAQANFSSFGEEDRAHRKAMIEAIKANRALRDALVPNPYWGLCGQ